MRSRLDASISTFVDYKLQNLDLPAWEITFVFDLFLSPLFVCAVVQFWQVAQWTAQKNFAEQA